MAAAKEGGYRMNIIAKAVKEVVLVPYRITQGADAAMDEVVNGEKKEPKK